MIAFLFVASGVQIIFGFSSDLVLLPWTILKHNPLQLYRLFTYPLAHSDLLLVIEVSLSLLLSGLVIEPRLERRNILRIIIGSSILGALTFVLLSVVTFEFGGLAGAGSIAWGYFGALFACWLRGKHTFARLEKIYTLLVFIGVVFGALRFPSGFITACLIFVFVLRVKRRVEQEIGAEHM